MHSFVRLPTLPTWLLVIFGCSPNWKCRWKGPDLSQAKTLCGTRRTSCTWFHKKLSRNVSSNGRTAGRSVCITKETTLKGIRVSDVKINNGIFADQRSDTFCTAHVVSAPHNPRNATLYCVYSFVGAPRINLRTRPKGHMSLEEKLTPSTALTSLRCNISIFKPPIVYFVQHLQVYIRSPNGNWIQYSVNERQSSAI